MSTRISIVVALGEKTNVIGKNNSLIWKLKNDLKRFKELTTGHPIIMGRKTFESIGRPLPHRTNIVITRQENYKPEGVLVVNSLEKALEEARKIDTNEIFVLGGGEIYNQALPLANRLYLTLVADDAQGDTFFPSYKELFSKEVSRENVVDNGITCTYLTLER